MWVLLGAVVTASLMGSMHCVGMCGPLAIWACGAGQGRSRRQILFTGIMYHLGRCTTYVTMGAVAGAIGGAIDFGGQWMGVQLAAARIAGAVMVTFGLSRLWLLARRPAPVRQVQRPSPISGMLVRLRPLLFQLKPNGRAFASGLLTTLLPCGWLYLFALVAAGTGSVGWGPVVMFAFWIGTLPALTALVAGARLLSQRYSQLVPAAAAALLVVTGCYTASGRGFADLAAFGRMRSSLVAVPSEPGDPGPLVDQVRRAESVPLPCCAADSL